MQRLIKTTDMYYSVQFLRVKNPEAAWRGGGGARLALDLLGGCPQDVGGGTAVSLGLTGREELLPSSLRAHWPQSLPCRPRHRALQLAPASPEASDVRERRCPSETEVAAFHNLTLEVTSLLLTSPGHTGQPDLG